MEELEDELEGICDFDDELFDEEEIEQEDTEDVLDDEEPVSLMDKFKDFATISEDKSRKRKVWSKKDHKILLGLMVELEGEIS
jgi:hypothetical protein